LPEGDEAEQDKLRKAVARRMKELQLEQQKRDIVRRYLEPGAYERLMNVRVSNYDLYAQLLDLIISMVQSNRITSRLSEDQLISILAKLTSRPEPTIEFRHK